MMERIADGDERGLAFHATVLKALCFCGLGAGVLFGIWHLLYGNPVVMATLIPAMVVQVIALYLLARDGFNEAAALMVAIVQVAGAVFYVYLVGVSASYWLFASSVANFYLIRWHRALPLNMVCCVVTAWFLREEPEFVTRFAINFVLVNIFLLVYTQQLEKKTREVAHLLYQDPLTRAGNRHALDAALDRIRERRERYDTPAALLMLDLDHFKRVNDQFGHAVGDQVLRQFSTSVMDRLRATDSLFRFGGEEFLVIAENTGLEEGSTLAESIRQLIRETLFAHGETITVSVGVAELLPEEDADHWLNRTDRALYQAKEAGRDCVRLSRPEA